VGEKTSPKELTWRGEGGRGTSAERGGTLLRSVGKKGQDALTNQKGRAYTFSLKKEKLTYPRGEGGGLKEKLFVGRRATTTQSQGRVKEADCPDLQKKRSHSGGRDGKNTFILKKPEGQKK